MILDKDAIKQLEQRYRAAFINSLAGFRQAVLVGTKSVDGHTNLAISNSLIHLGANPGDSSKDQYSNAFGQGGFVTVKKSETVFIVYFTSWVDSDGKLNFRKDLYERDKRLAAMLLENSVL